MLALAHLFQLAAVLLSLAAFAGLGWLLYTHAAAGSEIDHDHEEGIE
jgi:hypothetical protein